ncbi:MAG: hypothetical protein IKF68_03655 [Erysipelotrichaceae bacterium]|nr:hypothetical protein [Erysipelotrichaceae bacterium]
MKKIITVLLGLCLLLSLSACAGKNEDTPSPEETPAAETEENTETEDETATTELGRGTCNGNVYENESLNLRFELPENWVFYTEEEIAESNSMTAEQLKDTDIADLVAERGQYTDFFAQNASTGSSANLIISERLPGYTDKAMFEAIESFYREQFEAAGMPVKTYEVVTKTFCGEEKDFLHVVLETQGIEIEEYQLYVTADDSLYAGMLTISGVPVLGSDAAAYLDNFSKIH